MQVWLGKVLVLLKSVRAFSVEAPSRTSCLKLANSWGDSRRNFSRYLPPQCVHTNVDDMPYSLLLDIRRYCRLAYSTHRQALHAAELGFVHPVIKNRLSFACGMPADMQELFTALLV